MKPFLFSFYFHFIVLISTTLPLNLSNVTWRLSSVLSASKHENAHVLWTELGVWVFTIWKFILKKPPPLSPPSLIYISSVGIMPSCHVSVPSLSNRNTLNDVYHMNSCLMPHSVPGVGWSYQWGWVYVYAWAAPLISSPPQANVNIKGASLTSKLSPIGSRLRAHCFFSLPSYMPECFNHLKCLHSHFSMHKRLLFTCWGF